MPQRKRDAGLPCDVLDRRWSGLASAARGSDAERRKIHSAGAATMGSRFMVPPTICSPTINLGAARLLYCVASSRRSVRMAARPATKAGGRARFFAVWSRCGKREKNEGRLHTRNGWGRQDGLARSGAARAGTV
jgi:hypothetical protein